MKWRNDESAKNLGDSGIAGSLCRNRGWPGCYCQDRCGETGDSVKDAATKWSKEMASDPAKAA
jgi:hypothetical protein